MVGIESAPGIDRTGDGDGMGRIRRDRRQALAEEPAELGLGGRAPRAIDGDHLAAGGGVDREAVAADAGHVRIDHRLNRNRRKGGIHRIAAGAQDIDGRQRRCRMRRRGHAALADRHRTARHHEIAITPAHIPLHPGFGAARSILRSRFGASGQG